MEGWFAMHVFVFFQYLHINIVGYSRYVAYSKTGLIMVVYTVINVQLLWIDQVADILQRNFSKMNSRTKITTLLHLSFSRSTVYVDFPKLNRRQPREWKAFTNKIMQRDARVCEKLTYLMFSQTSPATKDMEINKDVAITGFALN
jgi:hypothetical protein